MLNQLRSFFEFPLIRRELTELAQRKRTYVLRCACLAIFTLVFLTMYSSLMSRAMNIVWVLGRGRELTSGLFATIMVSIYALAPAMACSAITNEKEKQTLGLLLISGLRPGSIVVEKILSRMLPLLSLIVVSAPLFAVCYLFGGLSFLETSLGLIFISLLLLQVVSVAVFCSALLETGIAAFWMTYVTLALIYFTWPVLYELGLLPRLIDPTSISDPEFLFFPVYVVVMLLEGGLQTGDILLLTLPSLLITLIFPVVARFAVVYFSYGGAFSFQKKMQRIMIKLASPFRSRGRSATGVRTAWQEADSLPVDDAINWRERRFGIINKWWVQLIAIPVVVILELLLLASQDWDDDLAVLLNVVVQIIALLIIMSLACRLFARERERQTLDAILVSPLGNREILGAKLAGVNSMIIVMLGLLSIQCLMNVSCLRIPFSTLSDRYDPSNNYYSSQHRPQIMSIDWLTTVTLYFVCALGNAFIYMHLVKWIAIGFGLRLNTQMKALVSTLVTVLILCFVPLILCALTMMSTDLSPREFPYFFFASPIMISGLNEWHQFYELYRGHNFPESDIYVIGFNFLLYGGMTVLVRYQVLRKLGGFLNRLDVDSGQSFPFIPKDGPLGQQLY